MEMYNLYNGHERSAQDWVELVTEADPRLEISDIRKPLGSSLSTIVVEFNLA